jgi:hypothetical protein
MRKWGVALWVVVVGACGGGSSAAHVDAAPADTTPASTIAVPLTGCGWAFSGELSIGGSPFRLIVDTGSASLVVAGSTCASCVSAGISPLYSPGPSATDLHRMSQETVNGSISGEVYQDTVTAGGRSGVQVALIDIASQTALPAPGNCDAAQGILGMAPASLLAPGTTSFPAQLAAAGVRDEFALHFCAASGNLWLGGYDPAAADGSPAYVDMHDDRYYTVALDDVAVAGTSVGVPASAYGQAIVDSGAPGLGLPQAAYDAAISMIAASPTFHTLFGDSSWFAHQHVCTTLAMTPAQVDDALPKLTVQIGNPAISIDLPATASYLEPYAASTGTSYCPAIFPFGVTDLGNTLIRAGLVIFDREQHHLGFAHTPPCTP